MFTYISVIVVCLGREMEDNREFMLKAHDMGMTVPGYVYIHPLTDRQPGKFDDPWKQSGPQKSKGNTAAQKAFERALIVSKIRGT